MAKVRKKTGGKVRKKKWLKIIAPKAFNNMILGESYVYDAKQLIGKNLKVNMMTLSRDPKQQHLNISFKVTKLDGDKGLAEVRGFTIVPSFLKRIVRRGKNKLDMSFKCKLKDKTVRIKPILLTRSLTHSSVLKDLRKTAIETIKKTFANYKFDDLVMDLLAYRVQRKIKADLGKIYPLKSCDIRSIKEEIVKRRKFQTEEPEEVAVEETPKEETPKEEAEPKSEEETSIEEEAPEEEAEPKSEEETSIEEEALEEEAEPGEEALAEEEALEEEAEPKAEEETSTEEEVPEEAEPEEEAPVKEETPEKAKEK